MLGLPKSTEFNKRIPKQKFYENLDISPTLKKAFVEQVKTIYWKNKIASTTMNLAPGNEVTEIEVFEIKLSGQTFDEGMLRQMDKEIPYHILFLMEYQGKYQAWIGYKEASISGNAAFKVNKYYHTEWMLEDELILDIEGLNMDAVWNNFIIQVGDITLEKGNSLEEQIAYDERKMKLEKEIARLEKQARAERQPKKKFELVQRIKEIQRKIEKEK